MLVLGPANAIPYNSSEVWYVYNLSSLVEGFDKLQILPPTPLVNYTNEKELDYYISNYIFSNPMVFYEFFYKVIYWLYAGVNIYLVVTRNYDQNSFIYDDISESILKIILSRYGYNGALINKVDDIDFINHDQTFTLEGVYALDRDKEEFSQMWAQYNSAYITEEGDIKNGASPL